MSTRTDFYIGRGLKAKWVGSCQDGFTPFECERKEVVDICNSSTEAEFVKNVNIMISNPSHSGTTPETGWMWDYPNSIGTDYIYVFSYKNVKCSYRGSILFNPFKTLTYDKNTILEWPDMSQIKKFVPEEQKTHKTKRK